MFDVQIRKAQIKDLDRLQKLAVLTFIESYNSGYPHKDLEDHAKEIFNKSDLKDELKSEDNLFYVAIVKKKLVGYLKLDLNKTISKNGERRSSENSAELTRLYVHPDMTGKRIGSKLLGKGFEIARKKNFRQIMLRVWKNNSRAIRFYQSMGFKIDGNNSYPFVAEKKTSDTIMSKKL